MSTFFNAYIHPKWQTIDVHMHSPQCLNANVPTATKITPGICTPFPPSKIVKPKVTPNPQNSIRSSPFRPQISAGDWLLHWMTPYGLTNTAQLAQHLPPHIIAREHVILVRVVKPNTLRN